MTGSTTARIETAPGTTVAYAAVGSGPAVALVHGLTESQRMWDPLVAPLAADHRVVTLDLPGHGESDPSPTYDVAGDLVPALAAVLAAESVDRPLLVGHSLGAWVVTVAAASLPCRGVLNIDQKLELSRSRASIAPLEPGLRGDTATFERTIRESFAEAFGALGSDERTRLEALRQPRQDAVLDIWRKFFEWTPAEIADYMREGAAGVGVPYLAIHGVDPGDAYSAWLAELIPGAVVEVWPDLGHYPHLVEPERFLARLRAFEQSIPEGASTT